MPPSPASFSQALPSRLIWNCPGFCCPVQYPGKSCRGLLLQLSPPAGKALRPEVLFPVVLKKSTVPHWAQLVPGDPTAPGSTQILSKCFIGCLFQSFPLCVPRIGGRTNHMKENTKRKSTLISFRVYYYTLPFFFVRGLQELVSYGEQSQSCSVFWVQTHSVALANM